MGAAAAAVVLFLVLRPGDDEEPSATESVPTTTETEPSTTAPEPATTATTPAPPPRPRVTTVRVVIRGGRPTGGIERATVARGRRVRVVVRSDVADHVHVHGYDLFKDVRPGRPARLEFRARVPGRFEIELEDRGLQIAELVVRP